MSNAKSLVFVALSVACLAPLLSLPREISSNVAPMSLIAGVVMALTLGNPFPTFTRVGSKRLLQSSVVLLGFSMDFSEIAHAGQGGIIFSFVSIISVFTLGWILQKQLHVRPFTGLLVSAGTAICGGSAIAALSSVIQAPEEDISVAVGTVFLLNAVALLIFPPLGHLLGLSQTQFGTWAGIAIHDIASVVGAGATFGQPSLGVATAVKLSRVLYIVPVSLIAAFWLNRKNYKSDRSQTSHIQIPWFVGAFLLASLSRSQLPAVALQGDAIKHVASAGFALALFLIGATLNRSTLQSVGVRPLVMGVILWGFTCVGALFAVKLSVQ